MSFNSSFFFFFFWVLKLLDTSILSPPSVCFPHVILLYTLIILALLYPFLMTHFPFPLKAMSIFHRLFSHFLFFMCSCSYFLLGRLCAPFPLSYQVWSSLLCFAAGPILRLFPARYISSQVCFFYDFDMRCFSDLTSLPHSLTRSCPHFYKTSQSITKSFSHSPSHSVFSHRGDVWILTVWGGVGKAGVGFGEVLGPAQGVYIGACDGV